MKHLITCSNAGEAGFLQSLLASAGIEAEVRDGLSDIATVPSAQLFVPPEQHAQAVELITRQQAEAKNQGAPAHPAPAHPAAGFPFLGIMGFTALLWTLASVVLAVSTNADSLEPVGAEKGMLEWFAFGAVSLLWGLMIGAFVALICLIAKATWKKLSAGPAARPNPGG